MAHGITRARVVIALTAVSVAACGQATPDPLPPTHDAAQTQYAAAPADPFAGGQGQTAGGFLTGDQARWPDYIPAAIPPFPADIRIVMTGQDRIRINYDNVGDGVVKDYLDLLASQGFALQYLYYAEEGFPDTSAERMARGEYDAVRATLGEYRLGLEAGGGTATLDIDTQGFEEQAATAVAIVWPAELAGLVPEPPRCPLISIDPVADSGIHLSCRPQDDRVDEDYLQALLDAGFFEESRTEGPDGSIIDVTLRHGATSVQVMPYVTVLSLRVIPQGATPVAIVWPAELAGLVPEPLRCPLISIDPVADGSFYLSCRPQDDRVDEDYLQALLDAGFVEVSRLEALNGSLVEATARHGAMSVQLMPSLNAVLGLRIFPSAP